MSEPATHPIQTQSCGCLRDSRAPQTVTLRAYEVYAHVFGPQEKLITGDCRGGFGVGELVAFLYAHSFPQSEWRDRVDEALRGFKVGR